MIFFVLPPPSPAVVIRRLFAVYREIDDLGVVPWRERLEVEEAFELLAPEGRLEAFAQDTQGRNPQEFADMLRMLRGCESALARVRLIKLSITLLPVASFTGLHFAHAAHRWFLSVVLAALTAVASVFLVGVRRNLRVQCLPADFARTGLRLVHE